MPALEGSKVISFVGSNTLPIVIHHQLGIYVLNWIMYGIKLSIGGFSGLSLEKIKANYWYTYAPDGIDIFKIVYLVGSIAFSLGVDYLFRKAKSGMIKNLKTHWRYPASRVYPMR